jgi:hypothetical protein
MLLFDRIPIRMPVYLMTSFARSGETLLLRALNAHPRLMVLHQILSDDLKLAKRAAKKIAKRGPSHIWVPLALRKPGSSILLVKHATWVHKYPHRGFIFARNPFAIVASMIRYADQETYIAREKRLLRIANGIDKALIPAIPHMTEVEAYSRLYLAKMRSALATGQRVFRYEDLTTNPKAELSAILDTVGLAWHEDVMHSERAYPAGLIGHGRIELSKPIRTGLPAYSGGLTEAEFDLVARTTEPVLKPLGYADLAGSGWVRSASHDDDIDLRVVI